MRRSNRRPSPTLRMEKRLLRGGVHRLGAIDEVGRGSLSGPVCIGLVVIDASVGRPPTGVRDSKLLSPARREELVPAIEAWAAQWTVGSAEAFEVDRYGITAGQRLAARRALAALPLPPDLVLLDGSHDWLTSPTDDPLEGVMDILSTTVPVVTKVKADQTCLAVAAASILAKVTRDAVMVALAAEYPEYGWDVNKGYGTLEHLDALRRFGPTPQHRVTWRLPEQVQPG